MEIRKGWEKGRSNNLRADEVKERAIRYSLIGLKAVALEQQEALTNGRDFDLGNQAGFSHTCFSTDQHYAPAAPLYLIDDGVATKNPASARELPKKVRKRIKPSYDPRKTPFVEKREDIGRLFQALYAESPTVGVAYAISALAGLRPGEVRALKWINIDLAGRKIYVRESVEGPTKSGDGRVAPIVGALHALLVEWQTKNPEPYRGLVCPPMRGATRKHLDEHTTGKLVRKACETIGIRPLTFYMAGRHSFASHWVLAGNSIEKLRVILGHSTVTVTERYAHLRPDLFPEADIQRADIPLAA